MLRPLSAPDTIHVYFILDGHSYPTISQWYAQTENDGPEISATFLFLIELMYRYTVPKSWAINNKILILEHKSSLEVYKKII